MIPRIFIAIVCLALLQFGPSSASASEAGASAAARYLFTELEQRGWNIRDFYNTGLLRRGDSRIIRTTLYVGRQYKLVAAGCEDAADVDIRVYDENGNFISGDNDTSVLAVADITPRWSGTFHVKVTMYNSVPNGAHYVLQYAFQEAQ